VNVFLWLFILYVPLEMREIELLALFGDKYFKLLVWILTKRSHNLLLLPSTLHVPYKMWDFF
jgi:hypothetical protein